MGLLEKVKGAWNSRKARNIRDAKKYIPLVAVPAFEVPLHEGLHAGLAHVLPRIWSEGIVLNNNLWYSRPLEAITLGYFDAQSFPPKSGTGGFAMLEYYDTIGGHLSGAVVSAAPEIATMTLGFYWIKRAINNIDDKGKQLYSVVSAYAGMALCSSTFHYLSKSSLHPESGSDHYGFTKHILDILPLPDAVTAGAAGLTTFIGAAVMTAGALYLANIIPDKSNDFKV